MDCGVYAVAIVTLIVLGYKQEKPTVAVTSDCTGNVFLNFHSLQNVHIGNFQPLHQEC